MEMDFLEWTQYLSAQKVHDQESIDVFYWELLSEYEARFDDAYLYYEERADLLHRDLTSHLVELDQLEIRFVALEEYEKCAAIRDLRTHLTRIYTELLSTD
jgi:hypothetical protein